MCEQRIFIELGLHVSMAIAPGAAAKEYPRRLTHGAVVHRPSEGLRIKGIDQDMDEGPGPLSCPSTMARSSGVKSVGSPASSLGTPGRIGKAALTTSSVIIARSLSRTCVLDAGPDLLRGVHATLASIEKVRFHAHESGKGQRNTIQQLIAPAASAQDAKPTPGVLTKWRHGHSVARRPPRSLSHGEQAIDLTLAKVRA
jgi:hypothetical protein